jgi:hypothetical protein
MILVTGLKSVMDSKFVHDLKPTSRVLINDLNYDGITHQNGNEGIYHEPWNLLHHI